MERTCSVCSRSFVPSSANQVYCPPTDEQRRRQKQPRSQCARRAMNAKRYGWVPASRPMPEPFDCDWCGKWCVPGENVAHHATKFCGKECKCEWHHIHSDGQLGKRETARLRKVAAADVWIAALFAEPSRMQAAKYKRAIRADPCAYCGTTPSGLDHIAPTSNGGADDWTNWSGCCKQCNSIKGALPLLAALPWVPVAREYHEYRRRLYSA